MFQLQTHTHFIRRSRFYNRMLLLWRHTDCSWTEHVNWCPYCVYIRYVKWEGLVRALQKFENIAMYLLTVVKICTAYY